ncbi:MAG: hypothetical protein Ct9H300mP8_04550 [Gammaproteobacteria bacterium]|nr:MAG: hypothetical protein Ct9H300mP8_04550 [Gammaproteobacteria bacterium]
MNYRIISPTATSTFHGFLKTFLPTRQPAASKIECPSFRRPRRVDSGCLETALSSDCKTAWGRPVENMSPVRFTARIGWLTKAFIATVNLGIPRLTDPMLRIKDQDLDGVQAEVIYGVLGASTRPQR